ncbi:MAG: DNA repair exonuclease [Coprothermobacterota bacterium]|nr:DNA repair exonuclease [Coprothermobacterota bacterium]
MMIPFSFAHTADLHLGTPFQGISGASEAVQKKLTAATYRAFENIVSYALENKVDFMLVAGDIFNSTDRSLHAQLVFLQGMKRLDQAGIPVYIAHGNHDPLDGWSAALDWPGNTHLFGGKAVEREVFIKESRATAEILGISFSRRDITDNLAILFPAPTAGLFSIGLLHCNVGATGYENYAPCGLQDLLVSGLDYWALGHVHTRACLHEGRPLVAYPGNPQGLHAKETGARGFLHVSVDEDGDASPRFIPSDSVRWTQIALSIDGMTRDEDLQEAQKQALEGIRQENGERPTICRLALKGRGPLHANLARANYIRDMLQNCREAEEQEETFVWVEEIEDQTRPSLDRSALLAQGDFTGELLRLIDDTVAREEGWAELTEALKPVYQEAKLCKLLEPLEEEDLKEICGLAETICLDRLLQGVGDAD